MGKLNPEIVAKFCSATVMLLGAIGIPIADPEIFNSKVEMVVTATFFAVGVLGYIRTWLKHRRLES